MNKIPVPSLRAVILSRDPIVVAVETYSGNVFLGQAFEVGDLLRGVPATVLIVPAGSTPSKPEAVHSFRSEVARLRTQHPNLRAILLANEEIQVTHARMADLEVEFIHQNAFIDENLYVPLQVSKIYDAVYNAQMLAFKRHYLAQRIDKLALIYYGNDLEYFQSVKESLANAYFANGEPQSQSLGAGNVFRTIGPAEISWINSSSSVGLCLSKIEGAMYASVEYLLSGVPVVTTENIGGRNALFNETDALFCKDDAEDVLRAVIELRERNIDPAQIRERCLQKIHEHRSRFFALMNDLCRARLRHESSFESEFHAKFKINRIWKTRTPISEFKSLI